MISFKNVSYRIKNKVILNDITFNIKDGEKVLLEGESGSGKSTILNLLMGNIYPSSGMIYYNGTDINKMNEKQFCEYRREKIIMILQEDDLFPFKTVNENLLMFYYQQEIDKVLKMANLMNLKDRMVDSLSGGERQRISIIKSCLANCDVLLCDEITSSLDNTNALKIINFIYKLFLNKTIIFISHTTDIFNNLIDHKILVSNHKIEDQIINDVNYINTRSKIKDKKSFIVFCFLKGLKKFSIFQFIIYILSILCFSITYSFDYIFESFAEASYKNYYDYNLFEVIDNNGKYDYDGREFFYDYKEVLKQCDTYINGVKYSNINYLPFYNKENKNYFVITNSLCESLNIDEINSISIDSKKIQIVDESPIKLDEKGMFSTSCIYYNYILINKKLENEKMDNLLFYSQGIKDDQRFKQNPLFEKDDRNLPYLESNAMKDYLTYKMVFESINLIVYYFCVMIITYCGITSVLLVISSMLKDIKSIAIYISRGFSYLSIISTYITPIIIYFLLMISIVFLYFEVLVPLLIATFIQLFATAISFYYIKSRKIHELLKEETLC